MYHAENKSLEELRIEDYISNRKVAEQLAIEKTNQGAVQNNNHPRKSFFNFSNYLKYR